MRVAALYDIHGNLPALKAVLPQIRAAQVDRSVVGGDVLPGPMPRETLDRLIGLDCPVHFLYDVVGAAAAISASPCPQADELFARSLLNPPDEADMLAAYATAELT